MFNYFTCTTKVVIFENSKENGMIIGSFDLYSLPTLGK